jgi:hypothetical protein
MAGVSESSERRTELRAGLLVGLGVMLAGVPTAVIWWLLAPVPELVRFGSRAILVESEGEAAVAADGLFAVCTLTAGLVCAVVVFARTRHARVGTLLGLALGGLAGALLAWRIGVWLGPASVADSISATPDGGRFEGPLALGAKGVLLAWPLASVIAFFALAAGLEPPDRRPWSGADQLEPGADYRSGARFPVTLLRPGYAIDEVDSFFARAEAGKVNGEEAAGIHFTPTRLRNGYDGAAVDAALAGLTGRRTSSDGSEPPSPR